MADALCGPSNALQSFQKHSQVDRTLQQDRITGPRHSPAQGFRTFDPRTGSLDADFHAFENAPTNPFQLDQPTWSQHAQPAFPAQSSSGWANDFQNLRISNSPVPVHQFRTEAPLITTKPGGWQQEFMSMRQTASHSAKQKQPETTMQSLNQGYATLVGGLSYMPQQAGIYDQQSTTQQMNISEPQFNEVDFEKAFQDAFKEIQSTEAQNTAMEQQPEELQLREEIHEPALAKIGADAINYTETKDRTHDQDARDANELARVAGELVQNVSHEANEKFKNSQFLDLMRRIRDREVEVRNNDFENAGQTQLQPQLEAHEQRQQDSSTFEFPNMNDVYRPDAALDYTVDDNFEYTSGSRTQISDLHPETARTTRTNSQSLQEAKTARWVPWPEAHEFKTEAKVRPGLDLNDDVQPPQFRFRLSSDAEAGDCWRSAVQSWDHTPLIGRTTDCFFPTQVEQAGTA